MAPPPEPPHGPQPPALGWSPLGSTEPSASVEAVPSTASAEQASPAAHAVDDDRTGWAMVLLPLIGGLGHLLIPIQVPAIVLGAVTVVATIVLMARDAVRRGQSPFGWVVTSVVFFHVVYLYYMHARRHWGAPSRLPYAVVAVVAFIAGAFLHGKLWGPAARVTVSCQARGDRPQDGYACTPRHLSGYQNARACWDLALTCDNQTALLEHVCAQVNLGEVRESVVPFDYSPRVEDCDKIAEARVDNLRVEVDPQWLERDVYPRLQWLTAWRQKPDGP